MLATTFAPGQRCATTSMLHEFGVALSPDGLVVLSDLVKAEHACIHHSRMPVALTAFAMVSPAFAKGRFPKTRLADLVAKAPNMDTIEKRALAAVVGIDALGAIDAARFSEQLRHIINHYGLGAFFMPGRPACHGIDVRPGGIDWHTEELDPPAMAAWRKAYKNEPPVRQMLIATILWLYNNDEKTVKKFWLHRLPCNWHAADAVNTLNHNDALRDWAQLVALYSGW